MSAAPQSVSDAEYARMKRDQGAKDAFTTARACKKTDGHEDDCIDKALKAAVRVMGEDIDEAELEEILR